MRMMHILRPGKAQTWCGGGADGECLTGLDAPVMLQLRPGSSVRPCTTCLHIAIDALREGPERCQRLSEDLIRVAVVQGFMVIHALRKGKQGIDLSVATQRGLVRKTFSSDLAHRHDIDLDLYQQAREWMASLE